MTNSAFANQEKATQFLRTGHYDTSQALGNMATEIVVTADEGSWHVPLRPGIEVVNDADGNFLEAEQPDVRVAQRRGDAHPFVEASYHAVDDETRSSEVITSKARFVPSPKS